MSTVSSRDTHNHDNWIPRAIIVAVRKFPESINDKNWKMEIRKVRHKSKRQYFNYGVDKLVY